MLGPNMGTTDPVGPSMRSSTYNNHPTEAGQLRPIRAVERTVLDGFAQVLGLDGGRSFKVGDCARNLENPVVGARRKTEARNPASSSFSPSAEIAQCLRI